MTAAVEAVAVVEPFLADPEIQSVEVVVVGAEQVVEALTARTHPSSKILLENVAAYYNQSRNVVGMPKFSGKHSCY